MKGTRLINRFSEKFSFEQMDHFGQMAHPHNSGSARRIF